MNLDHLISIHGLEYREVLLFLGTAEQMTATQFHWVKKLPTLHGWTIVSLFFEDSTRTRISFETVAKRLSVDVINFSVKGSSLPRGESPKDTALTLQAMGVDAVVVRHSFSEVAHHLAHAGWMKLSILNAGDGAYQRPTQALLDAMTLRRHYRRDPSSSEVEPLVPGTDLEGARVVIIGDILHLHVVRSNAGLFTLPGAQVTFAAPPILLPVDIEGWVCDVDHDPDHALASEPDAVMILHVQRGRISVAGGGFFPSPGEYHTAYGLDRQRFEKLAEKTTVMHPGPMNQGLKAGVETVDSPRAVIVEQVLNGVSARMVILYLLFALEGHPHD